MQGAVLQLQGARNVQDQVLAFKGLSFQLGACGDVLGSFPKFCLIVPAVQMLI